MEGSADSVEALEGLQFAAHEDAELDVGAIPVSLEDSPVSTSKREKKEKPSKKNVNRLSFAARAEIIALVESKHHKMTRKQIAAKFGITTARICQILNEKERRRVGEELERGICPNRKRVCTPKYAAMEQRLLQWIKRSILLNNFPGFPTVPNPLGMSTICAQARIIAQELGILDFTASNGWFSRFKERYGLSELARMSKDISQPHAKAAISAAALRYSTAHSFPLQLQQQISSLLVQQHQMEHPQELLQQQQQQQLQQQQAAAPLLASVFLPPPPPPQATQHQFQILSLPLFQSPSSPLDATSVFVQPCPSVRAKRKRQRDDLDPAGGDEDQETSNDGDEVVSDDDDERLACSPSHDKSEGVISHELSSADADTFLDRFTNMRSELSNPGDSGGLISTVIETLLKADTNHSSLQADV